MKTQQDQLHSLWRVVALTLAVVLFAAACSSSDGAGGDESSSSEDPETSTSEETAAPADDDDIEDEAQADVKNTEIRWFVGLGTGSQDEQIAAQDAVVDAFNSSQDDITLIVEYVDNSTASDVLATQIAAGNAPDIIGPVGLEGSNAFAGQYADLAPLVEAAGFDLSAYGDSAGVYRTAEGALEGIPFATFPSALWYNTELFDEAGIPYPPSEYAADGSSVYGEGTEFEGNWDWDKMAEIAAILTVDADGNDATSGGLDAENIVQFGFAHQWTSNPTSLGSSFAAGSIAQPDGTAQVPEAWVESWKFAQKMIHVTHSSPNSAQTDSDLLAGNVFNSGRVAMASTHLWYTCCIFDGDGNAQTFWDLGALPTYEGTLVSKLHGDTFRIHVDSESPQEAFTVLEYFFDEAALDLLNVYGGLPARPDIRDSYFEGLNESFTQDVNWDVMIQGLDFPDVPNHQANMPNFLEADARIKEFEGPLFEDPDFDIDAAVAELEADLNTIWSS